MEAVAEGATTPDLCGKPHSDLYASGMVKRTLLAVQELRRQIGKIATLTGEGEHAVLSSRGKPFAVIVPIEWYREAAKAMNDPTEY